MKQMLPISVVVMTFNEERNLQKCLDTIVGRVAEIHIVDSFSTDNTTPIGKSYTDKIHLHHYAGHPQQWEWALKTLHFECDWIFAVDADFEITTKLWETMQHALERWDGSVEGYFVRHRQVFRGRFLRHGTIYPRHWLRLFRKDKVLIDSTERVDVHFYVNGPTAVLEGDVIEDNLKERDIVFWIQKQIRFAERHALEELQRRDSPVPLPVFGDFWGTSDQRILWLKDRWYRLPLYWRPFLLFLYRYFLRFGFLDGKEGLVYHFTQALFYRLLVDIHMDELRTSRNDKARSVENVALSPVDQSRR